VRPRLAFARLSELEQRAHRLLYEERLPTAEAVRRLDHVDAHQAVQKVLALGDMGGTHSGQRPRLIALDNGEQAFDPPDGRDNPEDELLVREEMVAKAEREAALVQALRALPAAQRNILEQRFLLGRKPREIATETGIEIKEIYRVLERSVAQLRHLLARPS
jgi:RNA polymerase sigma factor (sigma-70 family)